MITEHIIIFSINQNDNFISSTALFCFDDSGHIWQGSQLPSRGNSEEWQGTHPHVPAPLYTQIIFDQCQPQPSSGPKLSEVVNNAIVTTSKHFFSCRHCHHYGGKICRFRSYHCHHYGGKIKHSAEICGKSRLLSLPPLRGQRSRHFQNVTKCNIVIVFLNCRTSDKILFLCFMPLF